MLMSSTRSKAATTKKRPLITTIDRRNTDGDAICNFCLYVPAALTVQLPVLGRKKRAPTPYCLKCYYTTSASRQDPEKYVSILDKQEQERQLPQVQSMFSECFLELQQELSDESTRAFQKQKSDPLAMLAMPFATSTKKRKMGAKGLTALNDGNGLGKKKAGNANDGGFLQHINIPERFKKTQLEQKSQQQPGQRRKSSGRSSIWNLAMNKEIAAADSSKASSMNEANGVACTCGSRDVHCFGNITSRNGDLRKGEIWGTDRDSIISRFQCKKCGRTWNEED
mmetsp:Transcript_23923/g.44465  ORF Transcript_23923/g.44465 Transcript_23923/m.44465 type:complete len:282 (+) Transcript_23923:52-897(+)